MPKGSTKIITKKPTKKKYPYKVTISVFHYLTEIKQWCHDNCESSWVITWRGVEFSNKSDATIFALMWEK